MVAFAAALLAPAPAPASDWPELMEGHGGPVRSVAVDPVTSAALTASFDYSAILWRLDPDGAVVVNRLIGHDAAVNDAIFVPNHPLIATSSDDGTIALWNLASAELVHRTETTGAKLLGLAASPDGGLVAAAAWDRTIRLIDVDRRAERAPLAGHEGNVNAVAFSADGATLLSAGYDGTIRAWDPATGALRRVLHRHGWGVNVIAPVDDGHILFGGLDGTAGVLDVAADSVRTLTPHAGPVLAAEVFAEAGVAAVGSADGTVRMYRIADWSLLHEYETSTGPVWGIAFAPDATMLYLAGLDDAVHGWQVSPRKAFEPPAGQFPRRFQVSGEVDPGALQFARKCSVCHTLAPDDANRAGPTLHGVFGRPAGGLSGYPYSEALLESDIVWTEETIARLFRDGPDVVTPGTKMPVQRIKRPEDLDALVAYLKRATAPTANAQ